MSNPMKDFFVLLKKKLDLLARETGFIKRQRVVTATSFLTALTFGQQSLSHLSLAGLADCLEKKISRTSLAERFTDGAVQFMKRCLSAVLMATQPNRSLQTSLLEPFRRVLLFDSTSWDLPPALQDVFPGYGGNASEANCKLQLGYDYKLGELFLTELTSGIRPDNSYTKDIPAHVGQGDLVLFDLGYSCLETYKEIESKNAFFLSRFNLRITVYERKNTVPLDLCKFLAKQMDDVIDIHVSIGANKKTRVSCRMIAMRVPHKVAEKRRWKLRREANKRGYTQNKINKKLAAWTIMITNIGQTELPAEEAWHVYSIRWQIELLFKQLKSVLKIHQSSTSKGARLQCEIYGTLIVASFIAISHASINSFLWNRGRRELSMDKFAKRIRDRAYLIMILFRDSIQKLINYLEHEFPELIRNCVKGKQLNRKSTLEQLDLFEIKKEMARFEDA